MAALASKTIINPIINKFKTNEIQFSKSGLEKFTRIYKKDLTRS